MSNSHLSRIETQWGVIREAHGSNVADHNHALTQLIDQYGPAIKRYLLASMRDQDAASEVFQEFALRLIRGDFRNADSHKGKFRNMIKTALYRLMIDYYRRTQKYRKLNSGQGVEEIPDSTEENHSDEEFSLQWRQSLLDQSWKWLDQLEQQTGRPYFTVLRARVDNPNMTTKLLYDHLVKRHPAIPNESGFRVFLHRARKRFAAILLEQVTASLTEPTDEQIENELIELGLHHYCKPDVRPT